MPRILSHEVLFNLLNQINHLCTNLPYQEHIHSEHALAAVDDCACGRRKERRDTALERRRGIDVAQLL
jgi:hypothetical protein